MHWLMLLNQIHHSVDQRITTKVAQLAQGRFASKVAVAIRITSWTTQRTLARNLNRHHRNVAVEHAPTRSCNVARDNTSSLHGRHIGLLMRDTSSRLPNCECSSRSCADA